jgi:type II secretory pathway predicted ATPase ExeA
MADALYLEYFSLKEEPFSTVANPRFFFLTPTHSTALEKTRYTVQSGKGLAVVYGETGTGKSSLARLLHGYFLEKGFRSVLLVNANFPTPFALLRKIASEFAVTPAYSYGETLDRLKTYLFEFGRDPARPIVMIIDEAQALRYPLLELLRQLMNYETNETKLLQLVLFGEEALRGKLAHARAASFRSRVAMASALYALTTDEVAEMVAFRWHVASGSRRHPFDDRALLALFESSHGIPREVAILADNALLSAFLDDKKNVDHEAVENAARDRRLHVGQMFK